jgi:hypothetical protein
MSQSRSLPSVTDFITKSQAKRDRIPKAHTKEFLHKICELKLRYYLKAKRNWRPICDVWTPVRLRSVTSAVGPTGHSTGMSDGGSGHADTINSGPTWAAPQANLRDHAVRLRNRRWRYCLPEVATAKAKPAAAINLIILYSLVCVLHPMRMGQCISNAGQIWLQVLRAPRKIVLAKSLRI